jgi:hypothetical protein
VRPGLAIAHRTLAAVLMVSFSLACLVASRVLDMTTAGFCFFGSISTAKIGVPPANACMAENYY